VLAVYLQLRAGELGALRCEDIDLEHKQITIRRAVKRGTGGREEKSTKSGCERRFKIETNLVPLLQAMLNEHRTKRGRLVPVPHEADLSGRLRRYLRWSGVNREELFTRSATHVADHIP
jgi:integrase